jgi:hypothetical protein
MGEFNWPINRLVFFEGSAGNVGKQPNRFLQYFRRKICVPRNAAVSQSLEAGAASAKKKKENHYE